MNYIKLKNDFQKVNGTHLQGYLNVTYKELLNKFGKPSLDGDGYKTDCEWLIEFDDGTIATIYNYKDGKNYNGNKGLSIKQITDWHIGGHSENALNKINQLFNKS